jgi:hypothetical protein
MVRSPNNQWCGEKVGPGAATPEQRQKPGPRLWDRIMLRLFRGEQFDGLWIGTTDDKREPILNRVREALRLIEAHDLPRYRRMMRDLKRILICPLPTRGSFNARIEACQLDYKFVLAEGTTPELLASVMVHEATHARLWNCGIGYDETMRPRVEAICVRRQLAFAKKLPHGQQAQRWAEETLTYCTLSNLSNARLSNRNHDWFIEETRRLGAPKWVVRSTTAFGKIAQAIRARRAVRTAAATER